MLLCLAQLGPRAACARVRPCPTHPTVFPFPPSETPISFAGFLVDESGSTCHCLEFPLRHSHNQPTAQDICPSTTTSPPLLVKLAAKTGGDICFIFQSPFSIKRHDILQSVLQFQKKQTLSLFWGSGSLSDLSPSFFFQEGQNHLFCFVFCNVPKIGPRYWDYRGLRALVQLADCFEIRTTSAGADGGHPTSLGM